MSTWKSFSLSVSVPRNSDMTEKLLTGTLSLNTISGIGEK